MRRPLTDRERDVLALIIAGCTNRQIAAILHIAETTVKRYINKLLDKFDALNRTQLAALALTNGVISIDLVGSVLANRESAP